MKPAIRNGLTLGVSAGALYAPQLTAVTSTVNCDPVSMNGCLQDETDDEVTLTMIIAGAAENEAYGDTGNPATVSDPLNGAFIQRGSATAFAGELLISNVGTARISATAIGTTVGTAVATASVQTGILQLAIARTLAEAHIRNSGDLTICAAALADGDSRATALANIGVAIEQSASGQTADAIVANEGTLAITAIAHASATLISAKATANIAAGLSVDADGSDIAIGQIENSGSLTLSAIAEAPAAAGGAGQGVADATIDLGFVARANGGSANAVIANNAGASLNVRAYADASGTVAAFAAAVAQDAVIVAASGSRADASVFNSGNITVTASAAGDGGSQIGAAQAEITVALGAAASAPTGAAEADLNNLAGAAIDLNVVADAAGASADAQAAALGVVVAIADSDGDSAAAHVTNSGAVDLAVRALAEGTAFGAGAAVGARGLIVVSAEGQGDTIAALENTGEFSIALEATATSAADFASAMITQASALLPDGLINVSARGSGEGTASATFLNSGTFEMAFDAKANGFSQAEAAIRFPSGMIGIEASGAGNLLAQAAFSNMGEFGIHGTVSANAANGYAAASIEVGSILLAEAEAGGGGGFAQATFQNSGSIDIAFAGEAVATDDAEVNVDLDGLFSLQASGSGDAVVTADNSGSIAVDAGAIATAGEEARASANGGLVLEMVASATGTGSAGAYLTNSGTIIAFAGAVGNGSEVDATASARGIALAAEVVGTGGGSAEAFVLNEGSVIVAAQASGDAAGATREADVAALAETGFALNAVAEDGFANITLENPGSITIEAEAFATGEGDAESFAAARGPARLQAVGANDAEVALTNLGVIIVNGFAAADAGNAASAFAVADGIEQVAGAHGDPGNYAEAILNNSGQIELVAQAEAFGDYAFADAAGGPAISQLAAMLGTAADGAALAIINNTSTLDMLVQAQAFGAVSANAYGSGQLLDQQAAANGGSAQAQIANAGELDMRVLATAEGGFADAEVVATVARQNATAQEDIAAVYGDILFDNSGTVNALATAEAISMGGVAEASADAALLGFEQEVENASAQVINRGSIQLAGIAFAQAGAKAEAKAEAAFLEQDAAGSGMATAAFQNSMDATIDIVAQGYAIADTTTGEAEASAHVLGIEQDIDGRDPQVGYDNAGLIAVLALATAEGADGSVTAIAVAEGYRVVGGLSYDFDNSGTLSVEAQAEAQGGLAIASAYAVTSFSGSGLADGTLVNTGLIEVVAEAEGEVPGAVAVGVSINSGQNLTFFTNSGEIRAFAGTYGASDGTGDANAVAITYHDSGLISPGSTASLVNDLGLIIAETDDDGDGIRERGTAIDIQNAPNQVIVTLRGDGTTYLGAFPTMPDYGFVRGNIMISGDDTISVANGETWFDGIVNPDAHVAAMGGMDPSVFALGTLRIESGGLLLLLDDRENFVDGYDYAGPSKAYVENFILPAGATLALHLPTVSAGEVVVGDYPTIYADSADITNSWIEARPLSPSGLFDGSFTYDDVIETGAGGLTGRLGTAPTLDDDGLDGAFVVEVLLDAVPVYDASGNVDLVVSRTPFGRVAGLTMNEMTVGNAIESTFDLAVVDTNPAYGDVLRSLFGIIQPGGYADALNQISGQQYSGFLRSASILGSQFIQLISEKRECSKGSTSTEICRSPGNPRLWGKVSYGELTADGDAEAGGFTADQLFVTAGLDLAVTHNFVLGVAAGYVQNDLQFALYDGVIDGDGYQLGAYATFDTGAFYANGAVGYTDLDGRSSRTVSIGGNAPFGSVSIAGNIDSRLWSAGGEVGARFPLGPVASLAPFAGLDYASSEFGPFEETGGRGAGLVVEGRDEYFAGRFGVELSADLARITPVARIAYVRRFSTDSASFDAQFSDAPPGTAFTIFGQDFDRDAIDAELGLAAELASNIDLHLGYHGRFAEDYERHAGSVTLSVLFGGE